MFTNTALLLYTQTQSEKSVPIEKRVPTSLNFTFLGNPGTGKTSVARLFGKLLHELKVRKSNAFIETTGEELVREGADFAKDRIKDAMGGVLFIDEAQSLDPANSKEGRSIVTQLLTVAENHRTEISIIIAGYKDEIEDGLYGADPGFKSRFRTIMFDDFNNDELRSILVGLIKKQTWAIEDKRVVDVAARRVARGRGIKGFANARSVRSTFEQAYSKALARLAGKQDFTFKTEDFMGPAPTPEHRPDLRAALAELEARTGQASIKREVQKLVNLAAVNYSRELNGQPLLDISLNRVFLGNPGTGKTTTAAIYGRILKGLGFLSDGSVELKAPPDFTGSAVGETSEKTSALIENCRGKVLVIDEAYGLNQGGSGGSASSGSSFGYGKEALDTLVGKVNNAAGDDIAVIMCGYEDEMKEMLLNQNPGLQRRFPLSAAFYFEDFTDDELMSILVNGAARDALKLPRETASVAVAMLAKERVKPNFGNAGAANELLNRAKQAMVARDPRAMTITRADILSGADKATVASLGGTGDEGSGEEGEEGDAFQPGLKLIFEDLEKLHQVQHVRDHMVGLADAISAAEMDGDDKSIFVNNYVFVGAPGTGKTTVARLMARMLYSIGVLSSDSVVECSALDLQGSYVGQTKDKLNDIFKKATGGVLFIDEAYSLGDGHFATEAQEQLIALCTSEAHLHKTVVILAGYTRQMDNMLTRTNPGLQSRFTERLEFSSWTPQDCIQSLQGLCAKDGKSIAPTAERVLQECLEVLRDRPGWANARDAGLVLTTLKKVRGQRLGQARRSVAASGADISEEQIPDMNVFTGDDAEKAMILLDKQRPPRPGNTANMAEERARRRASSEDGANIAIDEISDDDDAFTASKASPRSILPTKPPLLPAPPAPRAPPGSSGGGAAVKVKTKEKARAQTKTSGGSDGPSLEAAIAELNYDLSGSIQVCQSKVIPDDIMAHAKKQMAGQADEWEPSDIKEELKRQCGDLLPGLLDAQKEVERQKTEEEERIQAKLQIIGNCPMGFAWIKCQCGYRCAGGAHQVSDEQLK